ncbi:Rab3 GTPase-activating protein catalytic subunit-domain-containing protein [Choanephora cucurbitarum]|nr:Rab3 GTPase-activating protein catalytic subunit-domain-containing protein [Choanephora cucurbitarum]
MSSTIKRRQSSTYSEDLSRYEFVDYTAASDFEKLITHIEEIISTWGLKEGSNGIFSDHTQTPGDTRKEKINLTDDTYELAYHYHPSSNHSNTLAFPDFYQYVQFHPLHRWTGLSRLLILRPLQDSFRKKMLGSTGQSTQLSQAKQLISACAIAFQNTGCCLPIFVPLGQHRHELYTGYRMNHQPGTLFDQTESRFSMSLVPLTSPFYSLEEVRTLFIQKLIQQQDDYGISKPSPISMTTVLTYNLKTWFDERWKEWDESPTPKRRTSFSDEFDAWEEEADQMTLPFGSLNDPLRSLTLNAIFPFTDQIPEEPMDALTAAEWQLAREFAPDHQQRAYLAHLLDTAIQSWIQDPSNQSYLAPFDENNKEEEEDSEEESMIQSSLIQQGDDQVTLITSDLVEDILNRLFTSEVKAGKPLIQSPHVVPYRSLLWNMVYYSLKAMVDQKESFIGLLRVVWLQVLRKIRWHWEHHLPLPHISPYLYDQTEDVLGIDLRYPLIHQKLCMINCCIHRLNRSEALSEESDLFVDAVEDDLDGSYISLAQDQQEDIEGQVGSHPTLTLLKTGQPMQIPITQDPGFMTEDMVNEQADVFEKLGTSNDATQKRARLQSAQLLSDMQAFKAANPHACLEDFVRWHSPRDWIVVEGQGQLSARMSEPNNIWQELWQSAKRIPCARQQPLFDVTKEAEKALVYLETLSVQDVFAILLPTCGFIAYDTLANHPVVQFSQKVKQGLDHLGQQLTQFPWEDLRHGKQTFHTLSNCIRQQESRMCHAISLARKLPQQARLVDLLIEHDQAKVQEGQERSIVFELFKNDQNVISEPSYKEYMFYSDCQELTGHDRALPARQYALVKENEIRLVEMQSTDALYS